MKIIQLTSSETGDHLGIYKTERVDSNVESDIENAFTIAIEESEDSDDLNPHEIADEYLSMKGITRVYADEVFISNL